MLFCQLGTARSLREICNGLAASEGKLKHLGIPAAPKRSTLSYANEHGPWELNQAVFGELLQQCYSEVSLQKQAADCGFDQHRSAIRRGILSCPTAAHSRGVK